MRTSYIVFTAAATLAVVQPAAATTYTATASTFAAVFKKVASGDTLVLKGKFSGVTLANRTFSAAVTIDARAASFTDLIRITRTSQVNWLGGSFTIPKSSVNYVNAISVYSGTGISFSGLNIVGPSAGRGIVVTASKDISVLRSKFTGLKVGVSMSGVTDGVIANNISSKSINDGFDIADGHKISITGNTCSGTVPTAGLHPDCVQLWSIKGKTPNSDITISNNVATGAMQGFTSFNGSDGGGDRITITNNRVNTSYPQGIACYECRDSNISYNTVTTLPNSKYRTSINVVGGRDNKMVGNTVGARPAPTKVAVPAAETTAAFLTYDSPDSSFTKLPAFEPGSSVATSMASLGSPAMVPEPATWATMISGFAMAGLMLRRRRREIA